MNNSTAESEVQEYGNVPEADGTVPESKAAELDLPLPENDLPTVDEQVVEEPHCDLTPDQQLKKVLPLLSKTFKTGESWFALAKSWYDKWCAYVGHTEFDDIYDEVDKEAPPPGPIDNTEIIDQSLPLALDMTCAEDALMIHQDLWNMIVPWYGVKEGSIIERQVIEFDGNPTIDKWPKFIKVWNANPETGEPESSYEFKFDSAKTLLDIAHRVATELNVKIEDDTKVRLSFKFTPESVDDHKEVGDTKIDDEKQADGAPQYWEAIHETDMNSKLGHITKMASFTVFLLEFAKEDGTFPRDYEWDKENLKNLLRPGDIMDVEDTQKKWYQSVVMWVSEDRFKIHFKGWKRKWDEIFQFDVQSKMDRIQPVGTVTVKPHKPLAQPLRGAMFSPLQRLSDDIGGQPAVRGLVGLCNLGNTCFMNSVLQCLFQSTPFRSYFLQKRYEKDINRDNPLGWNGNVANVWGSLMEKIWGNQYKTVAPKFFKKTIGKVAPRFDGYQQQDSQEFLTFLLDGLHEDLNRIKSKPATENPESDGTVPDAEIAAKSWKTFLMRNDSVLVNMLFGQLKNQVVCPKCETTSIVFDPFTFLQLPLPVGNLREIPFTFVPADLKTHPRKCKIKVSAVEFIRTFKQKVAEFVEVPVANLRFYEVFNNKWYQPTKRFIDLESIRGLKDNEAFFVYEVDPLNEQEQAVAKARLEEAKRDYAVGDKVQAEANDYKFYIAKIIEIRENSMELPDNVKPEKIYTLQFKNDAKMEYTGSRKLRKLLPNRPRIDVCIKHLRDSHYSNKFDAFGMPQHLHLPTRQDLTNHEVLELVRGKIDLYVANPDSYKVYWKYNGVNASLVKLLDNNDRFPLAQFRWMVALPEIQVYWTDPDSYKDTVETEVHALQRQESALSNTLSIHECLKKFCETEILDDMNMVYCRKCKAHQNSSKTTTIWKLPDQLIIHFKRFSYGGDFADKVKTPVSFPLAGLDLSEYVMNEDDKDNCIYDLYGVSNHSGFLAGGHYTAYVKSLMNGKWYEMDDTIVTELRDHSRISSKRAYLVFYRRRKKGESAPVDTPLPVMEPQLNEDDEEVEVVPPTISAALAAKTNAENDNVAIV